VSLRDGVQPPDARARARSTGATSTTLRLGDYRAKLGVVLQDNFLFDGTVADNIAFSRPSATRTEIEEVSRLAELRRVRARLPRGVRHVVGERGVRLSGGQRQRIAIARALLADPRILILDEATSSLDSESEALIQEALNRLRGGRTTFVIAHRLSTIRSADQILVLEHGEIVERGSHAELMALGRPLPHAARPAVPVRAEPVRQPGRGADGGRRGARGGEGVSAPRRPSPDREARS
jgi:subfamily B ATP-binding cassette protein MsbA